MYFEYLSCTNNISTGDKYVGLTAVIDQSTVPNVDDPQSASQTHRSCPPTNESFNKTLIFVSAGVVISLLLVLLIVTGLRTLYKPIRPRIKKTFLVRNKMDARNKNTRTPLTCRPAAEQCEITIEDCCNMNICETVSFRV